MQLYRFANGQLYKLVEGRIIRINGKIVKSDKDNVFRMWIPVENK